jgi:hypothetical protein
MALDIESLGFTKEELQERVIAACVQRVFETTELDEDGDEFIDASPMAKRLEKAVNKQLTTRSQRSPKSMFCRSQKPTLGT